MFLNVNVFLIGNKYKSKISNNFGEGGKMKNLKSKVGYKFTKSNLRKTAELTVWEKCRYQEYLRSGKFWITPMGRRISDEEMFHILENCERFSDYNKKAWRKELAIEFIESSESGLDGNDDFRNERVRINSLSHKMNRKAFFKQKAEEALAAGNTKAYKKAMKAFNEILNKPIG